MLINHCQLLEINYDVMTTIAMFVKCIVVYFPGERPA